MSLQSWQSFLVEYKLRSANHIIFYLHNFNSHAVGEAMNWVWCVNSENQSFFTPPFIFLALFSPNKNSVPSASPLLMTGCSSQTAHMELTAGGCSSSSFPETFWKWGMLPTHNLNLSESITLENEVKEISLHMIFFWFISSKWIGISQWQNWVRRHNKYLQGNEKRCLTWWI